MKKYISMHLKTKLEYRSSFILSMFAQIAAFFSFYVAVYAKFDKFGMLKGFTMEQVLLIFSTINFGFSISECFFRGFDHFSNLIKNGKFDTLLIKPENIYLQILGSDIALEKIARALNAFVVFIYAVVVNNIVLNIGNLLILLFILLGAIAVFAGIFILGASICFYTVEGLEVVNILTDGSRQIGGYPLGIFGKEILNFFTFIIPVACINYYPMLYILGKSSNTFYAFYPIFAILFIIPAILIFNLGMKKYQSTGS